MPILRRAPIFLARSGARYVHHSSSNAVVIGIRKEDPERVWERRAPLTPDQVHHLVKTEGVRVLIQDCEKRVFPIDKYLHSGAEIHPTLEPAHIILGIKETPLDTLITSPIPSPAHPDVLVPRTHFMFSHTIKGQEYNMGLLSRFLAGGDAFHSSAKSPPGLEPRLIDYELLTDDKGKRTVMFGFFAGVAGALESLSALAHKQLQIGVQSPFIYVPRPHTMQNMNQIRAQLHHIAADIERVGTPKSLGPCIIGVTGGGNVTDGVMSILNDLPIERVSIEDLPALVQDPNANLKKVYLVHCLPAGYLSGKDGRPFERSDYYAHPDQYVSHFHTKVAPYLTLLINGAGWAPGFPRLLTTEQLPLAKRLAAIGDISCDLGGGLEFVTRATTLSEPTFDVGGVSIMSVDILPASLPHDASSTFGNMLERYLRAVIREYKGDEQPPQAEPAATAVERASIARGGKLREGFEWLQPKVDAWRAKAVGQVPGPKRGAGQTKQRVLILGSGMVAGPAVDELAGKGDLEVIIASNVLEEAQRLASRHDGAKAVQVDMNDPSAIDQLVSEADVVVSLLPVPFHPTVAQLCVKHKTHLVTASYISPAMKALHKRAADADVLLLNEIGLDPGIDHCSAHAMLERLRTAGRTRDVLSFISFCGGLPAPECADVPLGYKFSWSPRGVLRAAGEGAHFLLNGSEHTIPGADLLRRHFPRVPVADADGLEFEGLANRDSMPYVGTYDLPTPRQGLHTMLRGTLRYPGFANLMQSFKDLGFLESATPIRIESWSSFTAAALSALTSSPVPTDEMSVRDTVRSQISPSAAETTWDALHKLGLVPRSTLPAGTPAPPSTPLPPADLLAAHLAYVLRYTPGERDLVVLSHELVARASTGLEVHTSRLLVYGDARASAMARTVGLPVALAARAVLRGAVSARGVCGPTGAGAGAVWRGVLEGLEKEGIGMKESVKVVNAGIGGILKGGLEQTMVA